MQHDSTYQGSFQQYATVSLIVSAVWLGSTLPSPAQINSPSPTGGMASPTTSQPDVYFINRAKNLARQAAITANGGLQQYRPDPVMYGPAIQSAYTRNENGSITFSFTGGSPGYSVPSIETVATVMPDGRVTLDYNGAPRSSIGAGSLPPTFPTPKPPAPIVIPTPITVPTPGQSPSNLPTVTPGISAPPTVTPGSVAITPASPTPVKSSNPQLAWVDQDAFLSKARNLARQAAVKANGGLDRYRPEGSMYGPSSQSPAVKNTDGSITFTFKGGSPGSSLMTVESVVTVTIAGNVNLQYNGPIR